MHKNFHYIMIAFVMMVSLPLFASTEMTVQAKLESVDFVQSMQMDVTQETIRTIEDQASLPNILTGESTQPYNLETILTMDTAYVDTKQPTNIRLKYCSAFEVGWRVSYNI